MRRRAAAALIAVAACLAVAAFTAAAILAGCAGSGGTPRGAAAPAVTAAPATGSGGDARKRSTPDAAAFLDAVHAAGAALLGDPASGRRLLVVAGAHGDERSGIAAAEILAAGQAPEGLALAVLPRAAPEAVEAGSRNVPSPAGPAGEDFNRLYGAGKDARAEAILELALLSDLVLDLHESGGAWTEAAVPTLVISPEAADFALDLIESPGLRGRGLAFTGGAPRGSLVAELGARGRRAMAVEAPRSLSVDERVDLVLAVVREAAMLLVARR